ncbi:restriction endonuclease subunit S [Micromonospora orduensis]|uniref:Restriction endonuclease subunit S n=1 Tax=Micromonospora orduensis TaxID=1420891 RepID=A0A5C4QAT3_9ACTN|nr:restriction endonuclease subunit S [Micromonospora orduensis]TNH23104.1 restriction endonuclease subunit S [Micromonospora orduensis]
MSKRYAEYVDSGVPWLGDVPAGWTLRPLWSMFERVKDVEHPDEQMLSVFRDYGVVAKDSRDNINKTAENRNIYQLVHPGWLVTNRMKAWQGSVGISGLRGIVSGHYICFAPRHDADSRYLNWLFRSLPYAAGYALLSRGVRIGQAEIDNSQYRVMPVLLPSIEEQRAIADYLDRETTRVDILIEEQQRLIETLRERRHSLVDGAFGGLAPNARLRSACIDIVDCPHTTPDVSDDGEYEAVRTASVRNGKYRPGNGLPVDTDTWKARNAAGAPSVGDVLFTREAPAGEACMVPNDRICLGQRMVLLRIDHTVCVGAFLLWQIYSDRVQDHFRLSANGSTVANVRLPVLRTTPIWLPDLTEQRRIVAYLDEQTANIDNLITETEQFIELSKERRSALIAAAVTGQIDVREMA